MKQVQIAQKPKNEGAEIWYGTEWLVSPLSATFYELFGVEHRLDSTERQWPLHVWDILALGR